MSNSLGKDHDLEILSFEDLAQMNPAIREFSDCDGEMIAEIVRRGVRHGKVDEVLCVHN